MPSSLSSAFTRWPARHGQRGRCRPGSRRTTGLLSSISSHPKRRYTGNSGVPARCTRRRASCRVSSPGDWSSRLCLPPSPQSLRCSVSSPLCTGLAGVRYASSGSLHALRVSRRSSDRSMCLRHDVRRGRVPAPVSFFLPIPAPSLSARVLADRVAFSCLALCIRHTAFAFWSASSREVLSLCVCPRPFSIPLSAARRLFSPPVSNPHTTQDNNATKGCTL